MQEKRLLPFKLEPDYYQALGVEPEATRVEIEQRYREVSRDLNLRERMGESRIAAAETLFELSRAYEILSDALERSWYDIRRFGREALPLADPVRQLFAAGVKSYRTQRMDLALRYFKEASHLYPHRALFRVHLAIVYAEKQWLTNAENELETALRLDPEDRFAKEMVAQLLFEYESYSRERRPPLIKRMGTGLLSLVRTGPLVKGSKTQDL